MIIGAGSSGFIRCVKAVDEDGNGLAHTGLVRAEQLTGRLGQHLDDAGAVDRQDRDGGQDGVQHDLPPFEIHGKMIRAPTMGPEFPEEFGQQPGDHAEQQGQREGQPVRRGDRPLDVGHRRYGQNEEGGFAACHSGARRDRDDRQQIVEMAIGPEPDPWTQRQERQGHGDQNGLDPSTLRKAREKGVAGRGGRQGFHRIAVPLRKAVCGRIAAMQGRGDP